MTKQSRSLPGSASDLHAICLGKKALAASKANAAARSSKNKKNRKNRRSKKGRRRMKLQTQHGAPDRTYGNKPKKSSPYPELHGEEAPVERTLSPQSKGDECTPTQCIRSLGYIGGIHEPRKRQGGNEHRPTSKLARLGESKESNYSALYMTIAKCGDVKLANEIIALVLNYTGSSIGLALEGKLSAIWLLNTLILTLPRPQATRARSPPNPLVQLVHRPGSSRA
jgi:hypothetical protein